MKKKFPQINSSNTCCADPQTAEKSILQQFVNNDLFVSSELHFDFAEFEIKQNCCESIQGNNDINSIISYYIYFILDKAIMYYLNAGVNRHLELYIHIEAL